MAPGVQSRLGQSSTPRTFFRIASAVMMKEEQVRRGCCLLRWTSAWADRSSEAIFFIFFPLSKTAERLQPPPAAAACRDHPHLLLLPSRSIVKQNLNLPPSKLPPSRGRVVDRVPHPASKLLSCAAGGDHQTRRRSREEQDDLRRSPLAAASLAAEQRTRGLRPRLPIPRQE